MTKPIRVEHLKPCVDWWGGAKRKGRVETEVAWKVAADEVKARGYNLDFKNPNTVADEHGDPEELIIKLDEAEGQAAALRDQLKYILSRGVAPMNAELLLAHFNRISDAREAVPCLRRFILDLAVRGKLIEQNPNDEPASSLVQRIRQKKRKAIERGDARKEKPLAPLDPDDSLFQIPNGWCWSQLAEIGFLNPRNAAEDKTLVSFVPMAMISAEYETANTDEVRSWGEIKSGFTHFADGDVGLAKITPCFENGKSTVFRNLKGGFGAGTTELHVVRPVIVSADYVLIFLKSPYFIESGIPRMTGTAGQKRLPTEHFAYSPFPLPPLAEQHCIVAKVDELMKLCDRLEAAQRERENRRDRLTAASHHYLNNGADAESLRSYAQFFIGHLPRLTARPDQIKQLRQTILNLAVKGRLVEQSTHDETASCLLANIRRIKAEMLRDKHIHREQSVEHSLQRTEMALPSTWVWASVDDVAIVQGGKRLPNGATFSKEPTSHIYIRVTDMKSGTINIADLRYISPEVYRAIARYTINKEDLYITIAGTIGEVGRVPAHLDGQNLTENAAKIVFRGLNPDYFCMALNSEVVQEQFREKTKQMAQPKLALKRILGAKFPLPPLAEQHRIVAKVDELMSLCDQLEARLTTAQAEASRLLESVLHNALNSPLEHLESGLST